MSKPAAAALLLTLLAGPAAAHHSVAMFDFDRVVAFPAVVVRLDWANPHVWIRVAPQSQDVAAGTWGIEAGSTNTLLRQGWTRTALRPGDRVQVELYPMRDGSRSGSLVRFITADGRVLAANGRERRVR